MIKTNLSSNEFCVVEFFFFKQKTAYEMRISDWSSDVCSSDLRIIRNLLRQIGFDNVDEASDGASALQKLRRDNFGLVISDWNMEPMTGLELLKEDRTRVVSGKSVSVRVDLGGRGIIKQKNNNKQLYMDTLKMY